MPQQITFEVFSLRVNKVYLYDGEVVTGQRVRFILNVFHNSTRRAAFLFINENVTAIDFHSQACYFYDSHSRNSRGLAVPDGSSVLFKFPNISLSENYIQDAHLEYQAFSYSL